MEWSKAKTILIFVFIALNIFLLVNLFIERSHKDISEEVLNNTVKILEDNGIILKCKIPSCNRNISFLEYRNNALDKSKIGKVMKLLNGNIKVTYPADNTIQYTNQCPGEQIEIFDMIKLQKYLRGFFSPFICNINDFVFDKYLIKQSSTAEVLFTYKYNGYLVFDNSIRAEVTEKGIKQFAYTFKDIEGFFPDSTLIMPAHHILLKNMNDFKSDNSELVEISNIDLGFKGYSMENNMKLTSSGPAWRIILNNKYILYYSASDGGKIE